MRKERAKKAEKLMKIYMVRDKVLAMNTAYNGFRLLYV
jgi:hypothetical protein